MREKQFFSNSENVPEEVFSFSTRFPPYDEGPKRYPQVNMYHMFSIKMHPLTKIWTGAFENILGLLWNSLVKPDKIMNVSSECFKGLLILGGKKKKKENWYKALSNYQGELK